MIKVLGARRLLILGILLGINVVLAGAVYLLFQPQNAKLQADLNSITGQVSQSRSETQRLRTEFDVIQQQKAQFGKLQATDFFTAQDRLQARDRFEAIQRYSHVLLASYDMKAAEVQKTDELTEAGQVLLNTPVTVSVDALDDMDLYNFIYLIQNGFPGQTGVTRVEIQRAHDLDDIALREIGSGMPIVMIKGAVDFTWRTIVPENRISGVAPKQAGM